LMILFPKSNSNRSWGGILLKLRKQMTVP
jgi:hypothetical protein